MNDTVSIGIKHGRDMYLLGIKYARELVVFAQDSGVDPIELLDEKIKSLEDDYDNK